MIEESVPQPKPPEIVGVDSSGIRFGIDIGLFNQWRAAISDEDQEGFVYYGGDIRLAKFVCAFDYLTHHKRTPKNTAINNAYAAAYEMDPGTYTCRVRAAEAFDHPAVQYLLERFAEAELNTVKAKSTPAFSRLLARVLKDGEKAETLGDAVKALDAGTRFYSMMQREAQARRKRGRATDPTPAVVNGKTVDATPRLVDAARNAPEAEPEEE